MKTKFLGVVVILTLVLITLFAGKFITDNKSDNKIKSNTSEIQLAAAGKSSAQVYDIEKVLQGAKGKAIDFTWTDNGKKINFADYTKGKVVLLNFWATWCPPCRMEIPDIIALQKELPNKEFVVVGISLDNRGTLEQVRTLVKDFVKAKNINYINLLFTKDDHNNILSHYQYTGSIPTTIIIDKKGNVVEKIIGARSKSDFMNSIKRAKG